MSLGIAGVCKKYLEDDGVVIHTHAGENWNDRGKSKSGDAQLQNGIMLIDKRGLSCFY